MWYHFLNDLCKYQPFNAYHAGKKSVGDISDFSKKIGFNISCQLEDIGRHCQIQFYGENKSTIINLSTAEFVHRVVKINPL